MSSSGSPSDDPAPSALNDNNNIMEDDDEDLAPAFIQPDDAVVEVQVDDDDIPMDEDDDESLQDAASHAMEASHVEDTSRLQIRTHSGPVFCVASHYAADSGILSVVSGGGDDRAYLHRIRIHSASHDNAMADNAYDSPSSMQLPFAHKDSVSSLAFNCEYLDDKTPPMVAVGAYDGAIVLYDANTGAHLHTYEGPSDVEWLAFHPKGGTVLLAGSAADNTVWMFHLLLKQCLQVFVGHTSAVTCGCFSPDGKWALSGSSDGTLRIWAPRTGNAKHVIKFDSASPDGSAAGLTCIAINGGMDGQLVAVGAEDGQAHVCHLKTGKVVASLRHYQVPSQLQAAANEDDEEEIDLPMSVEAVGFCPPTVNPNWFATGGSDGTLKIWDLTNGQCRQVCRVVTSEKEESMVDDSAASSVPPGNNGGITRLSWHPTLPLVVTSCTNGVVYLWDARNGQPLQNMTGSAEVINDMAVNVINDGQQVIVTTASDDNSVRIHETKPFAVR